MNRGKISLGEGNWISRFTFPVVPSLPRYLAVPLPRNDIPVIWFQASAGHPISRVKRETQWPPGLRYFLQSYELLVKFGDFLEFFLVLLGRKWIELGDINYDHIICLYFEGKFFTFSPLFKKSNFYKNFKKSQKIPSLT